MVAAIDNLFTLLKTLTKQYNTGFTWT